MVTMDDISNAIILLVRIGAVARFVYCLVRLTAAEEQAAQYKKRARINLSFPESKTRRGRVGKDLATTLETSCNQGTAFAGCGLIRRLTPRECWRLQGFTDEMFDKARAVNSDNQLYRQAGNSVTVPVIYAIGKQILAAQKALECGE